MAPSSDTNNPHDALFRKTFSNVEHAAAELRAVLPRELLAVLDLTTLRLVPGSYVDENLAASQSDLLFHIEVLGKPALVYVLFEHQSSVDDLMPLRILKYVIRILDEHVDRLGGGAKALPLPVVIPVVLHHSKSGWTAATAVEQLFDADLLQAADVACYVPRLRFLLDDISRLSDDELAARALGMLPTLALWALRDARKPKGIERSLARWAAVIQALLHAESGAEALTTIFRYLSLVVEDLSPQTILTTLAAAAPETKATLMTTLAERWQAEGEARGRVEGEARGRVEGARQLLLLQLERKFGELNPGDRARVAVATEEELKRWSVQVLDAGSLAALLAD